MKHHRLISRKPEIAQSTLESKLNFKVQMVDRLIIFIFQTFGNGPTL